MPKAGLCVGTHADARVYTYQLAMGCGTENLASFKQYMSEDRLTVCRSLPFADRFRWGVRVGVVVVFGMLVMVLVELA